MSIDEEELFKYYIIGLQVKEIGKIKIISSIHPNSDEVIFKRTNVAHQTQIILVKPNEKHIYIITFTFRTVHCEIYLYFTVQVLNLVDLRNGSMKLPKAI